eukprot:5888-Pelagococcus_subviridis.AAC.2
MATCVGFRRRYSSMCVRHNCVPRGTPTASWSRRPLPPFSVKCASRSSRHADRRIRPTRFRKTAQIPIGRMPPSSFASATRRARVSSSVAESWRSPRASARISEVSASIASGNAHRAWRDSTRQPMQSWAAPLVADLRALMTSAGWMSARKGRVSLARSQASSSLSSLAAGGAAGCFACSAAMVSGVPWTTFVSSRACTARESSPTRARRRARVKVGLKPGSAGGVVPTPACLAG